VEPSTLFAEGFERVVGHQVAEHLFDELANAVLVFRKRKIHVVPASVARAAACEARLGR